MNDNGKLKSILVTIVVLALTAYSRYHGGTVPNSVPSTPPSTPSISVNKPSEPDRPAVQPPVESKKPEIDSRDAQPSPRAESDTPPPVHPHVSDNAPKRDLDQDEKKHGHTLQRHIGRTDQQLIDRLAAESVSSASTWTDKDSAERTIGIALEKNKAKIDAWEHQGRNRENFAFDYRGDGKTVIGRSMHRGATKSVPCYDAKIVLKADGDSFYVLTAYPESR